MFKKGKRFSKVFDVGANEDFTERKTTGKDFLHFLVAKEIATRTHVSKLHLSQMRICSYRRANRQYILPLKILVEELELVVITRTIMKERNALEMTREVTEEPASAKKPAILFNNSPSKSLNTSCYCGVALIIEGNLIEVQGKERKPD